MNIGFSLDKINIVFFSTRPNTHYFFLNQDLFSLGLPVLRRKRFLKKSRKSFESTLRKNKQSKISFLWFLKQIKEFGEMSLHQDVDWRIVSFGEMSIRWNVFLRNVPDPYKIYSKFLSLDFKCQAWFQNV